MTREIQCTCVHEYQDEKYGPGIRVHNSTSPSSVSPGWRCTVCSSMKGGTGQKKEKK